MPSDLQPWMTVAALLAGAYLVGAIPFGLLVGWLRGVDIRTRGSGNIGATNVGRVLGRGWGILVFVLDVLKGTGPVLLAGSVLRRPGGPWSAAGNGSTLYLLWVLIAVTGLVGHMFPVYLRFKGGKGVATSLGVLLGIYPQFTWPGLAVFALWGAMLAVTRYVSVASITAVAAFPIIFAGLAWSGRGAWGGGRELWPLHGFAVMAALLVVYRHRSNIRRLIEGTEARIGGSGKG